MNRHLTRLVALQALYEADFHDPDEYSSILMRNMNVYRQTIDEDFYQNIFNNVTKEKAKIDGFISKSAPEWPINQISLIDRIILEIAVFEIMIDKTTPPKVVINEAVELSKQFGSENSQKFVNGVLGAIYKLSEAKNE